MNAPWTRPEIPVRAPDRAIGGLLRSADREQAGQVIAGVPMQAVSDAVIATVRLGYQVADKQIERGRRLTEQLRGAAARAGVDDPEAWVEQTERLLSKALMAGSGLADGALGADSPLMRLARAELRLLARWLGMKPEGSGDAAGGKAAAKAGDASADPAAGPNGDSAAAAAGGAAAAPAVAVAVAVRLVADDPADRRAVRVVAASWSALPAEPLPLWFHARSAGSGAPLAGTLQHLDGRDRLSLHTLRQHPAGLWRAAVCLGDGLQIGSIDIEL